jgi:L-alanine-DL-glutamate epimerase-like enolase superfamily enzyme
VLCLDRSAPHRATFGMVQHMFTGMELTPRGVEAMVNYVAQVREIIGMEVPLAADHFGHIGVNSCILFGKALEKYNMAWLEEMIPWQYILADPGYLEPTTQWDSERVNDRL